ncbi:UvrD-helicase domain-containing protein [Spirosoma utsteinense]|uniref:DNA 3'-5' helicase n=1 Tax=Spirosoma utsteinense TaxID=2585773 RepID=A0ABR6W8L5_9BACT|nr:UvrD-helicase domain-containing protein [Spirosoma utsteinense]MBC3787230.1 ATP-dependent exoDNAse (exonuclease V) beta subunit [Spirosoma utsteinense]MBC3792916.1 ATP-dependent exoDNAse (exonuclease V) beta subunit [Spirosoma utsteinense]
MFKVYSSSAGSGKTYTLTKEYLKLALMPSAKDDYFRHILAVTFTNAAANEMKSRILERLRELADPDKDIPLLNELVAGFYPDAEGDAFQIVKDELRRKAASVFRTILHKYADFSVTTIDSFTQRIVMAFTDELGLPYSFEVEMETDEVLELAIDNLIEKAGLDEMEEITDILSDYYTNTATEGKSWNQLPELLKEFGRNLTSDQFYEAVNAAQELSPGALRAIRAQLMAHNRQVETDVVGHGQRAWKRITDAGLGDADFAYADKGVAGYLRSIAEGNAGKDAGVRVQNAVEKGDWYTKKTPRPVQALIDEMVADLGDCIGQIGAVREASAHQVALFDCLLPHLQKLSLLKQMRIEFDELLRKDGRVHISEFNKKILSIVASEPVPFLYERLGVKYHHILIDEFQDTSKLQFANLMPLIDNALGFDHFNLAVGDGKQAIYRFRGGDMDQIVSLHRQDLDSLKKAHKPGSYTADRIDMLAGQIIPDMLDTNWRSAEPIVRFNNEFFDFAARRFEQEHAKIGDVFDAEQVFRQKTQPDARTEGHVQIDFVAKDTDEGKDLTAVMLEKTIEHLEQALADGYQYSDIAILCRKKAHARALANELNSRRIPLVSADSLSLEFSEPVKWLVTLMRLLQQPDQKLLRYELLYLYHRVVRGVFPNDSLTEELRTVAEGDIMGVYDYLTAEGYPLDPYALGQLNPYELAERLTAQFNLFSQADHNPFLFRFLDEVLTFNKNRSGHLSDFLLYWDGVRQKISVEGEARNAISIQTIHKSKGLEFPVVIIPFANWTVEPNRNSTIWLDLAEVRTDMLAHEAATGEITRLLSAPASVNGNLGKTPVAVAAQYKEELTRTFLENMNLLYVAFTRPTDRLYIISKSSDFTKSGSHKDISFWLYSFLRDSEIARQCGCAWQEGVSTYVISLCADAVQHKKKTESPDEIYLDDIISGHRKQELNLRRQADRLFDVATFERTRERDNKLCAALSLIKGPGCIDKTLRQLVSEGVVRQLECDELRQCLTRIVLHPALANLFDATLRIDTDRSILSSKRSHGAPHRVVHYPDGSVILVQYESVVPVTVTAGTAPDPISGLRYFTGLYRDMGFAEVEGRLVYLSDDLSHGPEVIRVV